MDDDLLREAEEDRVARSSRKNFEAAALFDSAASYFLEENNLEVAIKVVADNIEPP